MAIMNCLFKSIGKYAAKPAATAANATTKVAPKGFQAKASRLFSVKTDKVIGTEIRNNITGTRYFQRPALNGRNVSFDGLTTVHRADGSYSSIPNDKFNQLLNGLKKSPDSWNPVIKSDPTIGKELVVNNPKCAGRYFLSNEPIVNHLITKITPERHSSMRFDQFDKMILDLLG